MDIEKQNQRLKNARTLMLDGEISATDFKEMRIDIEDALTRLNLDATSLRQSNKDYSAQIDFCVSLLNNIDVYYNNANTEVKQKIISSIFPEKLIFENNKYRTPKINEVISLLYRENTGIKKGKHTFFDVLSCGVVM